VLFPNVQSSFSFQFVTENKGNEEEEDSSFSEDIDDNNDNESQSLVSSDTKVSGSKILDLKNNAAANMPTPKRPHLGRRPQRLLLST
jgi:hypothetical protein